MDQVLRVSAVRLQLSTGQAVGYRLLRGHFHRRRLDRDLDDALQTHHRGSFLVIVVAAVVNILTTNRPVTHRAGQTQALAAHRTDARRMTTRDDTVDNRVHHGHPHRLAQRMAGREGQMIWKSITNLQCSKIPGQT